MDSFKRGCKTHACPTTGRNKAIDSRCSLCKLFLLEKSSITKRQRMDSYPCFELFEFYSQQRFKYMGCEIYFGRTRFNHGSDLPVMAGNYRAFCFHRKIAP